MTFVCVESTVVCHLASLEVSHGSRNVSEALGGDITRWSWTDDPHTWFRPLAYASVSAKLPGRRRRFNGQRQRLNEIAQSPRVKRRFTLT